MALTNFNHKVNWNQFTICTKIPEKYSHVPDAVAGLAAHHSAPTFGGLILNKGYFRVKSVNTSLSVHHKSWVLKSFKSRKDNDPIKQLALKHEQGHFDIYAIGIREMIKKYGEVKVLKANKTNKKVQKELFAEFKKIDKLIHKKIDSTNIKYDAETNHSTLKRIQDKWSTKLNNLKTNSNGCLS